MLNGPPKQCGHPAARKKCNNEAPPLIGYVYVYVCIYEIHFIVHGAVNV